MTNHEATAQQWKTVKRWWADNSSTDSCILELLSRIEVLEAEQQHKPSPLTIRDKYIEEKYPLYFVWGNRADGCVDIATTSDDTVATVSQEHAEKLIQDRSDLVHRLCDMAQAFAKSSPEEFEKFWDGHCLPQPQPVPVIERPWEREGWCDAKGRCWLSGKVEGDWRLMDPVDSGVPQLKYCFSHSLPHWVIPAVHAVVQP